MIESGSRPLGVSVCVCVCVSVQGRISVVHGETSGRHSILWFTKALQCQTEACVYVCICMCVCACLCVCVVSVRFSLFVCVCFRFWNSIQMDAGKAVSMTTGQEMTVWATSPQTWGRTSRGQVCHHTQTHTHTHTHTNTLLRISNTHTHTNPLLRISNTHY